jgi:phage tail-like protein
LLKCATPPTHNSISNARYKNDKSETLFSFVKFSVTTLWWLVRAPDQGETMKWELTNAFPCKMTVTDMESNDTNAAAETIELAREGLAIVN